MKMRWDRNNEIGEKGERKKNSISPPQLFGVDYIISQAMKRSISLLNFSKPVKLPPKAVLKIIVNHRKIIK